MPIETCAECCFDSSRWNDQDTVTTMFALYSLCQGYLSGASAEVVATRPVADQWSIGEYLFHIGKTTALLRAGATALLAEPGMDFGTPPDAPFLAERRAVDVVGALTTIQAEAAGFSELLLSLEPKALGTTGGVAGETVDVRWIARHAVHDAWHHLHDIGRIRHRLGDESAVSDGTVVQLNRSDGGVPKINVPAVDVDWSGVTGDRRSNRRHHGRPFQALCLWSIDQMHELRAAGHPINPGQAGENITVEGVEWSALRPGMIFGIGDVIAEISSYATPCKNLVAYFTDRDFRRIDQDHNPGWSRLYASVLRPGEIREGDALTFEPPL